MALYVNEILPSRLKEPVVKELIEEFSLQCEDPEFICIVGS
jgi:hypothetical protein